MVLIVENEEEGVEEKENDWSGENNKRLFLHVLRNLKVNERII